jgi:hypothetical protein
MKKPLPSKLNILYDGRIIHHQVTEDEAAELLMKLAEQSYRDQIDSDKIDFEYI